MYNCDKSKTGHFLQCKFQFKGKPEENSAIMNNYVAIINLHDQATAYIMT